MVLQLRYCRFSELRPRATRILSTPYTRGDARLPHLNGWKSRARTRSIERTRQGSGPGCSEHTSVNCKFLGHQQVLAIEINGGGLSFDTAALKD